MPVKETPEVNNPKDIAAEKTITIYSRDSCQGCRMTAQMLEKAGIPFEIVDLTNRPELIEEFLSQGLAQAPVVEHKGERTAGFRPDRIRAIVSSINAPDAKAIHNVGQQGTEASHVPTTAPAPAQYGRTR